MNKREALAIALSIQEKKLEESDAEISKKLKVPGEKRLADLERSNFLSYVINELRKDMKAAEQEQYTGSEN